MTDFNRLGDAADHGYKVITASDRSVVGVNEPEGKDKYGQGTRM
ncbi:hypothetical protein PPMP20_21370 [Paraburkholderia phymatum]|nr:hypothetical protein [Paraburkholderia phymatum]